MSFSLLSEQAAVTEIRVALFPMWDTVTLAMAKRPTKQLSNHSWAIYHIRGTPAQFIGQL
jgi:hypothetical protein